MPEPVDSSALLSASSLSQSRSIFPPPLAQNSIIRGLKDIIAGTAGGVMTVLVGHPLVSILIQFFFFL